MIYMGNKINVNINNLFSVSAEVGILVSEIAHDYKKVTGKTIVGAKVANQNVDFTTRLTEDTKIDFFDYTTTEGSKIYQAGLKFLMIIATKELWNKSVFFKSSIDKGIYAEFDKKLTDKDIEDLKMKMKEIVGDDYLIKKCITHKNDAIRYYLSIGEEEKAKNIKNIPNNFVELYCIGHTYNYFYTDMPASTGELGAFDIARIDKNTVALMYPRIEANFNIPEYNYNEAIFKELIKYNKWSNRMDVEYASKINELISESKIQKFIKMDNIFINDSLYTISKDIAKKIKDVKMILIGGPSSSGKTTSAHKMCTYLETFGVKPIVISADDYFKERIDTPKDKDGNYDFECLEAIDLSLFNSQLNDLLSGKSVVLPTFNFLTGKKEYKRDPITMTEDNVLLIEGLHCLNDKMTSSIKRDAKYKIFVCPLTPTSIDRHTHFSTTDMRLIRRIVRDNRVRGHKVETTLQNFEKVKEGESKYIFPYTDDVDAVLNTAYTYEIGVLRVFAEPLLYSIPLSSPHYAEAHRLLGLLHNFFPISSEYIEDDNTLREFIGGSIYEK